MAKIYSLHQNYNHRRHTQTHKHTYTKSMLTRTHIHNICTMYSEWYSSKKEEDTVKRQHTYDDGEDDDEDEEMFSFCEN